MKVKKDNSFSVLKLDNFKSFSSKSQHKSQENRISKPSKADSDASFNGKGMFGCSKLPDIPELPSEFKNVLNNFKADATLNEVPKKTRTVIKKQSSKGAVNKAKKKKTKLNGFMAYRAFFSRDVIGIKAQRGLSSCLSKAWQSDENQLIWKRYATEYNAQAALSPDVPFVEWLMKTTGRETEEDKKNREWLQNVKSGMRIQDVYFDDKNELLRSEGVPNALNAEQSASENFNIEDFDFDSLIRNGRTNGGFPIDPLIENIQSFDHIH